MDYDLVTLAGPETVAREEIAVNGVPCFQWTAMVIPADAVSRNTISGKKGPTYYSGRRMRQYYADNTRLLEEMKANGQKVTIFPRHAAALMESALPLGWVDHYELRPSTRRPGMEDMWYVANAPLTSEGVDMRMKMRSSLVEYSSLRTFPPPRLKTEPVKLNGQIVEEAVDLPIAGIDLVATQPGLPVEPIRVLEEAVTATIETLDPRVDTTAVAPASTPAPTENTTMRHSCPACKADIDAVVDGAVAFATHAVTEENKTLSATVEKQKEKRKAAETELETLKASQNATEEAKTTAISAELAAVKAQLEAVVEENKALASVKNDFAVMQARDAMTAKVRDVLAKDQDQGFAKFIKQPFKQAVEEAMTAAGGGALNDHQIDALYWRVRSEHTPAYFAQRTRKPSGYGHVTLGGSAGSSRSASVGTEEDDDENDEPTQRGRGRGGDNRPTHAGRSRGVVEEDDDEGTVTGRNGRSIELNRAQLGAIGMIGRMG